MSNLSQFLSIPVNVQIREGVFLNANQTDPVVEIDGKTYLRSGVLVDPTLFPLAADVANALGEVWTQRALPVSTSWRSVTYGNGVFVAVADNSSIAASSVDGVTWTQRALPVSAGWYSVTYGNGVFVAVAFNSSIAASSVDGVTWTQRTLPVSAIWYSVTYGNGVFVVVAFNSSIAASSGISLGVSTYTPNLYFRVA